MSTAKEDFVAAVARRNSETGDWRGWEGVHREADRWYARELKPMEVGAGVSTAKEWRHLSAQLMRDAVESAAERGNIDFIDSRLKAAAYCAEQARAEEKADGPRYIELDGGSQRETLAMAMKQLEKYQVAILSWCDAVHILRLGPGWDGGRLKCAEARLREVVGYPSP